MSICQGCPASWKVNTETSPINATAKIRRVESPLPAARQDIVAAKAMATMTTVGSSQSVPRIMLMVQQIGICSQSTASNILLVVSRKVSRSLLSTVMSNYLFAIS